ncbi:MAG: large subunit ribosomal protein [Solirubrobacteraceae bacterium]|jgi:large subunit ribosomal protein L21|nr:large subunit ribosomal protein [Solirubrobacteraceae bacterium]
MPKTLDKPYAVLKTGGKQYIVTAGEELLVERLREDEGASVTLESLFSSEGEGPITATIVGHERGPKIRIFKYKPKRGYKRRMGHRQELTRIRVEKIS